MAKNKNKEKASGKSQSKGQNTEMRGAGDGGKMNDKKGQTTKEGPAGAEFYS